MSNETPTPHLFGWIKDNWTWLTTCAALVGGAVWYWINTAILKKIKTIGGVQKKIVRVIPVEALEKGLVLMTEKDCTDLRSNCQNHIVTNELMATMTVMKQAMALVISHNREIPQEKKDKIMEELVK